MTRNLVADVNDNLASTFTNLADNVPNGETRSFGPIIGASSGIPARIYNRVFVFSRPSQDDLAAAVAWLADRDVPAAVSVADPVIDDVEPLAADVGLVRGGNDWPESEPGMAMDSLDEIPPNETKADIVEVTTSEELDAFIAVATSVFGMPHEIAEQVYQAAFEAASNRLFLARVASQPAACGQLVQSEDVAGVYTIGVTEKFRRQGIGEAMSWQVLRAGREAGCHVGVLESSEMAFSLYEKMGFETVVTYHHFEPAT